MFKVPLCTKRCWVHLNLMHPSTVGLEVWFRPVRSHVLLITRLVILTLTNEKVTSEQNRLFENSFPVWSTLWWGVRVHPPQLNSTLSIFCVFHHGGHVHHLIIVCVSYCASDGIVFKDYRSNMSWFTLACCPRCGSWLWDLIRSLLFSLFLVLHWLSITKHISAYGSIKWPWNFLKCA